MQVLADAAAVDARYERGEDIGPFCGLGFVVKDNIDVAGNLAGLHQLHLQQPLQYRFPTGLLVSFSKFQQLEAI